MTAFRIGADERAAMAAGQRLVVAAAAFPGLPLLGRKLLVLVPRQGVLRLPECQPAAPGVAPPPAEPGFALPSALRPLAILAPDAASAADLAAGLPDGVPRIVGTNPMPALLDLMADALADSEAARLQLLGRPGSRPPALRQRVIDLPPGDGPAPPARLVQSLQRPAEGLCGIALHVAAARLSAASLLRVRLLAKGRVIGAWLVPGSAIAPGWLCLDLPEPAPAGSAEAVLEVAVEVATGELLRLSPSGVGGEAPQASHAEAPLASHAEAPLASHAEAPLASRSEAPLASRSEAPLALRADVAEPGHLVLPQHFDWAARDLPAPLPGLALPIAEPAWRAARIEGGVARLVAAGGEPPRLLIEVGAESTARIALHAVPPGAADLALAELACRLGAAEQVQVALRLGPDDADDAGKSAAGRSRHSAWRIADPQGALRIALPLPPGLRGALAIQIEINNRGGAPVTMEVAMLALMAGAAGTPRRMPAADPTPPFAAWAPARSTATPARYAVPLPDQAPPAAPAPLPVAPPWAARPAKPPAGLPGPPVPSNPPPPLASSEPGAPLPPPPPAPLPMAAPEPDLPPTRAEMPPGGADFQDLRLHQHSTNADRSYQHIDVGLTGLVSATGVWREIRLKLFERRGTLGLEFRRIKGWPPMFDVWPQGGADNFGPYWRVETEATAESMARLAAAHDRAMVAALLEVLPTVARHAARLADLSAEDQEAWSERGRTLAATIATTRPEPAAMLGRVG